MTGIWPLDLKKLQANSRRLATQLEAEAASRDDVDMSPLGVKQQIDARLADQPTAEGGSNVVDLMTSLGTKQQIDTRLADETTLDSDAEKLSSPVDVLRRAALKSRTLSGTGMVPRTIVEVTQDWFNVKEAGIVYSGDETAKLQAAINKVGAAGGGKIIIDGQISVTSPITNPWNSVKLWGTEKFKAGIVQTNQAALFVYRQTALRGSVQGLTLKYATVGGAGQPLSIENYDFEFDDIILENGSVGLDLKSVRNLVGRNFKINFSTLANIRTDNCIGVELSDGIAYGELSQVTSGNLRMQGLNQAVNFRNIQFLGGASPFASTGALGSLTGPAYCNFTDVFFDGASGSADMQYLLGCVFSGCWWSGGREDNTNGALLQNSRALAFNGCRWMNCGKSGMLVAPTAQALSFAGGQVFDNWAVGSPVETVRGGITIADGTQHFTMSGIYSGKGAVTPYGGWSSSQTHGVVVGGGCDKFDINVRDFGNETGAVGIFTTAGTDKVYRDCF